MFKALLDAPMREGKEGVVTIQDVRAPVFRTLLHFVYTDSLPEVRPRPGAWLQLMRSKWSLIAATKFSAILWLQLAFPSVPGLVAASLLKPAYKACICFTLSLA